MATVRITIGELTIEVSPCDLTHVTQEIDRLAYSLDRFARRTDSKLATLIKQEEEQMSTLEVITDGLNAIDAALTEEGADIEKIAADIAGLETQLEQAKGHGSMDADAEAAVAARIAELKAKQDAIRDSLESIANPPADEAPAPSEAPADETPAETPAASEGEAPAAEGVEPAPADTPTE